MIFPSTFSAVKRPQAVLFDYDGVLVASDPIHLSAWMQLLAELNLPSDKKIIQEGIGKTAPEIIRQILDLHQPGWDPVKYDVHQLAVRKNDCYLEFAKKALQVYPGVIPGLQWLRSQNIKTAIVSNGKRRDIDRTMDLLGLGGYFDQTVSRDDVVAFKPDPTPYLFAAASLGIEPSRCMAVEDSPTGLEAALLAKIPTAAVLTTFPETALKNPVPGRPDLSPLWIGSSIQSFFDWLKSLT